MQAEIIEKMQRIDLRNAGKSLIITIVSAIILFLATQVWNAIPGGFPDLIRSQEEKKFEFVAIISPEGLGGTMDYGTDWKGSGDVNSYDDPSPTPGPGNPSVAAPNPNPGGQTNQTALTSTAASEVKVSATDPIKKETGTGPTGTGTNTNPGGSNHGNTNQVGNWGRPDQPLNPNANFQWGEGGKGLGGRRWLDLPDPVYTINKESKITFDFVIAADGSVKTVKPPVSSERDLVRAGMEAIRKWRFEPVDEDRGEQPVSVTIVFKLK